MRVYLYETFWNGASYKKGALNDCVDISIEDVAPVETTADRNLWDIQAFLDKNYPDKHITFKWKEINVDWGEE